MTITEVEFNLSLKQALDENNVTLKIVRTPYSKTISFVHNNMRYLSRGDFNSNNELEMQSVGYTKETFLYVEEKIPFRLKPSEPCDFPMERKGLDHFTLDEEEENEYHIYYKTVSKLYSFVNHILMIE
jgi:hypothetical protein